MATLISITHVAELARSEPGLAGLMLRCGPMGVEALVILLTPLPPSARPHVALAAGENEIDSTADMVPPFSSIRLADAATARIIGEWQTSAELKVSVAYDTTKVSGVISLAGLPAALQLLKAQCLASQPGGDAGIAH